MKMKKIFEVKNVLINSKPIISTWFLTNRTAAKRTNVLVRRTQFFLRKMCT